MLESPSLFSRAWPACGLKGFDVGNWFGIYGPRGTPPEIITRVNTAFN